MSNEEYGKNYRYAVENYYTMKLYFKQIKGN